MKRIAFISAVLLILGFVSIAFPVSVSAHTGSGTVGDPYLIYDDYDLQDMQNHLTSYWELANDIDATNTSTWNAGAGFVPVGTLASPFSGFFDGKGYTITGLYINRVGTSYVGLFGAVKSTAAGVTRYIRNVNLVDSYIAGTSCVGTLLGNQRAPDFTTALMHISSVTVTNSTLVGSGSIGGLIGLLTGYITVEYCFATDIDISKGGSGGLIGTMEYSGGSGVVTTIYRCGASDVTISHSAPQHTGSSGAFVGSAFASAGGCSAVIRECYSDGSITLSASGDYRAYYVGGFCGYSYRTAFIDCYSFASVTTTNGYGVGGFLGSGNGASNCYSAGAVATTSSYLVGGFQGRLEGACGSNSFWDKETSGQATSACGTGKLTSEMKTETTFTNAGWNFTTIWGMFPIVNSGYPFLQYNTNYYQAVWFQPIDIISGTTLLDRAGNEDGIISWGSNPAGISVAVTAITGEYVPGNYTFPQDIINPQDMIGPTGNPGMTRDVGTLPTNPLYPFVKMLSDHWGATVQLWWIILTSLFVLICMVVTYRYLPHQMIVALVGGGLCSFFYAMGIYPFWVPLIFAVWGLAVILGERSPTV